MSQISESQRWSAADYQNNAGFVPALGAPVLELLAPNPGEDILDLGCGDGALTQEIAKTGARVVGVDASAELLDAAGKRGLKTRRMDGQNLTFAGEFDAVFSNAALHWMRDHDAVIAGVRRALRPSGRFVGELGGHGNVAAIITALIAVLEKRGIDATQRLPWHFPTAEEWSARLRANGFSVSLCAIIARPTPLPTGLAGWLKTFGGPFVGTMPEDDQAAIFSETERILAPSLKDSVGQWSADYVRLRFAACLP